MPRGTFTIEEFWAELGVLGPEKVQENLASNRYGDSDNKRVLAQEWLHHQKSVRREAFNWKQWEQIEIARAAAAATRAASNAAPTHPPAASARAASNATPTRAAQRAWNTVQTILVITAVFILIGTVAAFT